MTDVLLGLQREFPGYRIWQESHGERKRFVACRIVASTRPHSVVTADPDELRDALSEQHDLDEMPEAGAPLRLWPGRGPVAG